MLLLSAASRENFISNKIFSEPGKKGVQTSGGDMSVEGTSTSQLLDLQEKLDDLLGEERRHVNPAVAKFSSIRAALFDRRKELIMRIPYFWLRALIEHPALSLFITDLDSRMLRTLVDVDFAPVRGSTHPNDFELLFTFARNDYFVGEVLTKKFTYSERNGRVVGVQKMCWKDASIGTLIARNEQSGQSGFFRWLSTDTLDISNLGDLIKDEVCPQAIDLFFGTYYMDP